MRVAFVHYHVKTGGVTRVMENAFKALSAEYMDFDGVVLSGHPIPDDCILPTRVVDGLGYVDEYSSVDPKVLVDRMESHTRAFLGDLPDVWHIHNFSLGKNPSMVDAVVELVKRGHRLVLQIHDFAEDGRPFNYRLRQNNLIAPGVYPIADNIRYVVLNGRDYNILRKGGIPESHLTWLPNPVQIPKFDFEDDEDGTLEAFDELIVYPVRAVRRKNIGELLLHAVLSTKRRSYITTLGTTSQDFVDQYQQWKDFANELGLHVHFEVSRQLGISFETLIDHADYIISTSVAEGFGLGFIEPWIFGKTLIGRDLPEITEDFKKLGVQYNHLYSALDIPISAFRFDEFRSRLASLIEDYHLKYGVEWRQDWLDQWIELTIRDQMIDFAKLDEIAQREVIEAVQSSFELQMHLSGRLKYRKEDTAVIDSNSSVIEMELSIAKYGQRLREIYDASLATGKDAPIEYADDKAILSSFFSVERFLPLRT